MAFSTLMLVGCPLPPTAGANGSHVHAPATLTTVKNALPPLQVRNKEEQEQEEEEAPKPFSTVARRAWMLHFAAASLSGIALFSTKPVEARVGRVENKRKAREKFEMLREKAGLSKPETGNKEETPLRQQLGKEEKVQILPLPAIVTAVSGL